MSDTNIFSLRVLEQRKRLRLSQKELAEKLGLSNKAISTIESGKRGTSIEKLIEMAYLFHVSTDYLLGITNNPEWRA